MENKNINIISNFMWRLAERFGAQIVQLIVSIVLARLLAPEAYGTVTLVIVITNIFQVFVDSGLANALIQKKNADDLDFSSVFYFNVIWCLILYGFIYFSSPFIANFYNNPELTSITRVLGLTIIISGLKNVQQAYVTRTLQFKKFFFSTLIGIIISAIIGIIMAVLGFGVWSLVVQKVLNILIDTIILWLTVQWRPIKMFSFSRLKELISFGWKLLLSSLLDTVYTNLRSMIIGKIYNEESLAYYNQGNQLPNILAININSAIDSVLFPVMSKEQNNIQIIKSMTRRAIKMSTYIMTPIMIGLLFTADNVIKIIFTDSWLQCVPYLRIFCITYIFYPIHTANLNAIKAIGKSDIFLKLEIIKKGIGLILLLLSMNKGVMAIAYSFLVSSFASQIINSWPNRKLLNYSYIEQMIDILPNVLLSLIMGIIVYAVGLLSINTYIKLFLQIIIGIIIYFFGSIISKNESFDYLYKILLEMFKNKKII